MTFIEFLNSLSNGANLFFTSLGTIANYLITNYIFLVVLGTSVILSLVYYCFGFIFNPIGGFLYDLDNPDEKNKKYYVKGFDERINNVKKEKKLREKFPNLYRRYK